MFLVSLSCLMTVTVLNFHHKGNQGREVPWCVRKVFLDILGTVLCANTDHYHIKRASRVVSGIELFLLLLSIFFILTFDMTTKFVITTV